MSAPIAPLLPRLRPLIGKLASVHDAEVVSAARAMGRLLQRQGMTLNDLAAALEGGSTRAVEREHEPDIVLRD